MSVDTGTAPGGPDRAAARCAALVGVYVPLWQRQRDDAVLVQALGAVLAAGASTLWLGGVPVAPLLPLLAGAVCAAVVASLLWPDVGYPVLGVVVLGLVGWLAVHDVARRTIRSHGLVRFMAGCLLAGYFWLAVAGAIWSVGGPALDGARYDGVVHAVFLGFGLSMIMAHAPVILPAVLRRPLRYHPVLIAPVVLLHLSLVLRLWVGDGLGVHGAWQVGGVLNITALLLFAVLAAWSAATAATAATADRGGR